MALRVPPSQIASIKKFLGLPEAKTAELLGALTASSPQFNLYNLSREMSGRLDLPLELIEGIVEVLAALYLSMENRSDPIEKFVDDQVYKALKKTDIFSGERGSTQWGNFREFLVAALSLDNTLGTAAKAGHVMTQHEHIL